MVQIKKIFFVRGSWKRQVKTVARFLIVNIPWIIFLFFLAAVASAALIFLSYKDIIDANIPPQSVSIVKLNEDVLAKLLRESDLRSERATSTDQFNQLQSPFVIPFNISK